MCGICGIIHFDHSPIAESSVRNMMQSMKHRGPDDEGIFMEDNAGLGFVRLSIIDLSPGGHQPMYSDDGKYVMVFNGEIYNYIEIREELKTKGHVFKSKSDTEVLLKAYVEWGEKCLHKFDGMWAFVIFNRHDKTIFAARDRYGIKPFYYYFDGGQFIFASEIQAILGELKNKQQANDAIIFDFLIFNRTDQSEETFFKNIKKLKHGHHLKIANDRVSIQKWYDLKSNLKEPFKNTDEYIETFRSTIEWRMRSDVPVGVCLSGGLDSSSIVSILLKDFQKSDINTFSAVYNPGQLGDESEYIHEFTDQLKSMHFTRPTAESFYADMHQFVKVHAEPIPSTSPYAQYKVMELAKKNVVVTLDGQGADESLAGYHYFFGLFFKDLLLHGKPFKMSKEIIAYLTNHKSLFGLQSFGYFLLPNKLKTRFKICENGYLLENFTKKYEIEDTIAHDLYAAKTLQEGLLNHFEYKLEHLLKWEDKNSMWFSLEARVPFLDYRLVERTLSLPNDKIISGGTTKSILREAMKGILPEKIRNRQDKVGFGTPEDEWFKTPAFQKFIIDLIHSESFKSRDFIDYKKATKLYQHHLNGKMNISKEIWKWIHLELWFREFID
jgi:asparagine synthase (glutamine-hydrolysing)